MNGCWWTNEIEYMDSDGCQTERGWMSNKTGTNFGRNKMDVERNGYRRQTKRNCRQMELLLNGMTTNVRKNGTSVGWNSEKSQLDVEQKSTRPRTKIN